MTVCVSWRPATRLSPQQSCCMLKCSREALTPAQTRRESSSRQVGKRRPKHLLQAEPAHSHQHPSWLAFARGSQTQGLTDGPAGCMLHQHVETSHKTRVLRDLHRAPQDAPTHRFAGYSRTDSRGRSRHAGSAGQSICTFIITAHTAT